VVIGKGLTDRYLSDAQMRELVEQAIATLAVEGKRVLIIIPDGTRTMPMPLMFSLFKELLAPRVKALDYLVALGTHQPMSDAQLSKLVGRRVVNGQARPAHIFNHLDFGK
jgi:nickel-dependent lactate racemase